MEKLSKKQTRKESRTEKQKLDWRREDRVTLNVIEVSNHQQERYSCKTLARSKRKCIIINTLGKHYYNKRAQDKIIQNRIETNRISNNTTKTEIVVKMISANKEDNAGEGRSLRSRRVNEKAAIKKKKSCREMPLEIKTEKGNNLRIFCSTTAFENIRKIIIETVASNYVLEMTENKDISGKVVIETIKTKERNARRALPLFVINIYRTTSTLLINGPQVQRFVQKILPVLQSWADQNKKEIDICDQH